MTDRDLAIARAALEAAKKRIEAESHSLWEAWREIEQTNERVKLLAVAAQQCDLDANLVNNLDPAAIVAGVPPRHKAERVMDELNHHALDENQRLAARVAELEKALVTIRDSTYRSAVTLRGLADDALRARVAELEGKYAALKETLDPNSIGFSMAVMIAEAEEKADSLRARVAEQSAVLRQLEWSSRYSYCTGWPSCPVCNGIKPGFGCDEDGNPYNTGHRDGCLLHAVMREGK